MKEICLGLFALVIEVSGFYYLFAEKNCLFGSICLVSAIAIRICMKKEDS